METTSNAMATTVSRRGVLARLLMAAVAPGLGMALAGPAHAKKKTKKLPSIRQRVKNLRQTCEGTGEAGGGTAKTTKLPGGTTVACTGSRAGDWTCTVHSRGDRCHATRTTSGNPSWQDGSLDEAPPLEPADPDSGQDPVLL